MKIPCDTCGRTADDVRAIHTFSDGSTYDMCKDTAECHKQQGYNEYPCCGGEGCEGCTPLWKLEQQGHVL